MKYGFIEPRNYASFYPINVLRPTYELFSGAKSFSNRLKDLLKTDFFYYPRKKFRNLFNFSNEVKISDTLLINPMIYEFDKFKKFLNELIIYKNTIFLSGDEIIAIYIKEAEYDNLFNNEGIIRSDINFFSLEVNINLIKFPWDIVKHNHLFLEYDLQEYERFHLVQNQNFTIFGENKVSIGDNTLIMPTTIFDTRKGDIYIGDNVEINGFSSIEGPTFIGKDSILHNADVRGDTTIGENCRISGEISSSIFFHRSNKAHTGFIGHSYISEWVNLGAMTTNSNLKNNYSNVYYNDSNNHKIDAGTNKAGVIIGDHTKLGIQSCINTGSIFGIFCNLFGGQLLPKFLPNFTWGDGKNNKRYLIKKALETTEIVMKRRNFELSEEYKNLLIDAYNKI